MQYLFLSVPKRLNLKICATAVSGLVLGLSTSFSAAAAQAGENASNWGLGIVAVSSQKAYAGIDRNNIVIPLIYFENEYVRLFGPGIDLKLPSYNFSETQKLDFSLVAQYDPSGYDDDDIDDTPVLNGMHERKGGFWAGGKIEWRNDLVDVNAEWLADVSGRSKGNRFSLGLEKTWVFEQRMKLTPRVKAIWQDKKYVDYYYGVRDDEVLANRAAYQGDAGVNVELGVKGTYMFNQKHSVFLDVKATSLADEIKNSPLVDRSTINSMLLGYMYRF